MIERSHESLMNARVEGCFREIVYAVAAARVAGVHLHRRAVLDSLRTIKAKTIEAEVLLRALDRHIPGVSQL